MPARSAELASRIQRIEDRLEILDLPARYSRAVDDRDLTALADLFCADARWEHGAPAGGRAVGREAIVATFADILGTYGMTLHVPHMHVVERIEGDEANGWVAAHAEITPADRYVLVAVRYEDDYRREDGRWRFSRRELRFWYVTERASLSEVARDRDRVRFGPDPQPADLPALPD
jgi:uncharacterized protein (TIGR02246 family)